MAQALLHQALLVPQQELAPSRIAYDPSDLCGRPRRS